MINTVCMYIGLTMGKVEILEIDSPYDLELEKGILVFTTNGNTKKNNRAVMGRGIAKWVRDNVLFLDTEDFNFKPSDIVLGKTLLKFGNIPFHFKGMYKGKEFIGDLISFPTKNNFWEKSNLDLMWESAQILIEIIENESSLRKYKRIYIPLIGTENGKRKFSEIKPILSFLKSNLEKLEMEPLFFKKKK